MEQSLRRTMEQFLNAHNFSAFKKISPTKTKQNAMMMMKAFSLLTISLTGAMAITLSEVAQHNKSTDCWTAVSGKVYDLTAFIASGGHPNNDIDQACGVDGT